MHLTDEVYPLEDVVNALKANSELKFAGIEALGCPTKVQCSEMHLQSCNGIPGECDICQNQKCIQYLVICRENNNHIVHLVTLKFRFLIHKEYGSGVIYSGFIPKEDSELKKIIGKYIVI